MCDFLGRAIEQAKIGGDTYQEVPVGAVIVSEEGRILSEAHNEKETQSDPTAHAEILAIQRAAQTLGDWRLTGATLYVTLEPCPMCLGAILHARIARVVFGAKDSKWGACGSTMDMVSTPLFNHSIEAVFLPRPECKTLLQSFFKRLRR